MDINSLLSQFTANAQQRVNQNATVQTQLDADTARIKDLMTVNEQTAAMVAATTGQLAAEQAGIDYRIGKAKEANAALVGMNPDDLDNEMVRSMAAYTSEQENVKTIEQQRSAALRTAEQIAGTNFLENPVQYLVGQLALPTVAAKHNTLLNQEQEALLRRDRAADNITTRMQLLNARNSAVVANTAEASHAIALKKAEQASQIAQIELNNMKMDNISKLGARALDSYRLAGDTFQIQSDLINKQISLEQWAIQRAQLAEQRAAAAAERKARADAKAETDAERELFNKQLAAASMALGYQTPITLTSIKVLPKDKQEQLVKVAVSGKFGSTMLESLATVEQAGIPQVITSSNPGMATFMRASKMGIQNYQQAVVNEAAAKGQKLTGKEAVQKAADNYEYEVVNSAQSFASPKSLNSPQWDTTLNPYKPQYFALVDVVDGGAVPSLKNNSVVAAVKTLKAATAGQGNSDNLKGRDIETLLKVISQQVADGKLSPDTAARDIAKFHQTAAAQNISLYNYTQFGLPQQTSAIVTVPAINSFTQPFKLDLMDPASVKKELVRMSVDQKKGTLGAAVQPFLDEANRRATMQNNLFKR